MNYLLAALPILVLLTLMLVFRWSGPRAGLAGWVVAVLVGAAAFGLNPQVFWISQYKGLLLSIFVLAILWPALFLYNTVQQTGGIRALAQGLQGVIGDTGFLALVLAWIFSGLLESLAGFGIPIAVVAPMLAGIGVEPVTAVAAVAIGHTWAVTFGDMGIVFQTLAGVVQMDPAVLLPASALLLGITCLLCGLVAAALLKQLHRWPVVLGLGAVMAFVQYGLAAIGLTQLACLGAGFAGVAGAILLGVLRWAKKPSLAAPHGSKAAPTGFRKPAEQANLGPALGSSQRPGGGAAAAQAASAGGSAPVSMRLALASYGALSVLMMVLALPGPIRASLIPFQWQATFPEVTTRLGFVTQAGLGQSFRLFLHPGMAILLVGVASAWVFTRRGWSASGAWRMALRATWRSAAPSSLGVIATVGISALMDHTGMTLLLAQGLSGLMGGVYPLISPWVGILGAFTTGSNNNSNVLFGMLQKNAALILGIAPALLVAAQTTGGALGSMLSPAKIVVGCSTLGLQGKEGAVIKKTLPFGLVIGLLIGAVVFLLSR